MFLFMFFSPWPDPNEGILVPRTRSRCSSFMVFCGRRRKIVSPTSVLVQSYFAIIKKDYCPNKQGSEWSAEDCTGLASPVESQV